MIKVSQFIIATLIILTIQSCGKKSDKEVEPTTITSKVVFGKDERTNFSGNTVTVAPYHKIGRFNVGCTGTLVGSKHVITAAHCIYNLNKHIFLNAYDFYPGLNSETATAYTKVTWTKAYIPKKYYFGEKDYDIAIVELSENIGDELGWFNFGYDLRTINSYVQTEIAGYPADKPRYTLWKSSCRPYVRNERSLEHKCDTFGGMSGSALRNKDNVIYAIHRGAYGVAGNYISNSATLITPLIFNLVRGWTKSRYTENDTVIIKNRPKLAYDKIIFHNKCYKDVYMAIKYKDYQTGSWITNAWYEFKANQKSIVAKTNNIYFYYYAISKDRTSKWEGLSPHDVKGTSYNFKKKKITTEDYGTWTVSITCNN